VIAAETGVASTVDPFGGSYAIEALTGRIEAEARALLDRIDAAGGTLAAIEHGIIQREIQESAYRAQQEIDTGSRVVVGVNQYADGSTTGIDVLQIDPAVEAAQCARVRAVRASRDASAWRASLDGVVAAARTGTNLVPPIVQAVEARATVGEISDALRSVFGEHREIDV
jgi:methylmalonyl-CoA mutase N-terminal domain/subunit